SKSSGTLIPGMKPTRFISRAGGASSGTTLTSGLPALAIMKGSPFAARSTNRERWVLASWILTVRIAALSTKLNKLSPTQEEAQRLAWFGELALWLPQRQDRQSSREGKAHATHR